MSKIDEKLRGSEIRYRRLFESAKDGILILDFKTGNIVDANPFIIQIIDYPLEEIIGKKLWEIGLFSNKVESELAFAELKKTGYIRFEDMPILRRNGKTAAVEFVSNVYLEDKVKVIQCNIRDITARRQAERRQELLTRILSILGTQDNWKQLIHDIIIEIKTFTGIEAVGIRLKEKNDYPYYEAIGFREFFVQAEKSLCARDSDGRVFHDQDGKSILECLCGRVISGQINHSLPCYTSVGSFFSNSSSEMIAAGLEIERHCTVRMRCNTEGYESVALIPVYSGIQVIGVLQLNDKKPGMVPLETIQFFEQIGNSIGIAFNRILNENQIRESAQDLILKNIELLGAKLKAEESDNLKSAFLANVSHEIRTPMNAIIGFSDVLLQPGISAEEMSKYVQIIRASGLQLLSVINDIIDISRIDTGQISIGEDLVNVDSMLNDLFVTYKKLVELKKLRFKYSAGIRDGQVILRTDGNRVRQVICNLLNNAIKFTQEGEITFGYTVEEGFIRFFVKDTGIGIAPENTELIFRRFAQVVATGKKLYGGNGLGLSISKALVEKLGGAMTVESKPGKGSVFIFTVPYDKMTGEAKVPQHGVESISYDWGGKTILIVEDEVNNHTFLEEILSRRNVKILHAWDGFEAVEQVMTHPEISLVLMDIKMPVMDGFEATRFIKKFRPSLPVIAQTAYALASDRERAMKGGCDDFIVKPIERIPFLKMVNRHLTQVNMA
jgi:PAS domain S-box-containing protein